jgi:soluble lytic murein transglycosylase-like protein
VPASYGLAQITKDAAVNRCGVKNHRKLFSAVINLSCAATILQEDIQTYGSLKLAIAAYNAGTACICDGKKYLNAHDSKLCNVKKTSPIFCNRKGAILNRSYVKKVEDARREFGLSN